MANKKGGIGGVIIIIVIIAIIGYFAGGSSDKKSSSKSPSNSSSSITTYSIDIRPDSQKTLSELCVKYDAEYKKGENDLQKSSTRNSRRRELQQLGLRTANNWIGTLSSFGTNSEGKAFIKIKFDNNNITVMTMNNAFSDSGYNTLIALDSNLFKKLSEMKTNSKVRFSGTFITGDDKDHIKTTNLTEIGAMSTPDFLMRFSDVTLLSDMPFATEDINVREEPSSQSSLVVLLNKGTKVKLLSNPNSDGWIKISTDGKDGYVNSSYLTY